MFITLLRMTYPRSLQPSLYNKPSEMERFTPFRLEDIFKIEFKFFRFLSGSAHVAATINKALGSARGAVRVFFSLLLESGTWGAGAGKVMVLWLPMLLWR